MEILIPILSMKKHYGFTKKYQVRSHVDFLLQFLLFADVFCNKNLISLLKPFSTCILRTRVLRVSKPNFAFELDTKAANKKNLQQVQLLAKRRKFYKKSGKKSSQIVTQFCCQAKIVSTFIISMIQLLISDFRSLQANPNFAGHTLALL